MIEESIKVYKNLAKARSEDCINYQKEIERLNNIIDEFNHTYSKVITKCDEMINSRFYMNDIAIKQYAEEIKNICYFYINEAKELKEGKENDK